MKEYKIQIIEKLEENAKEVNAVLLRKAAIECGYKHIKTQDCYDIINGFLKRNPEYKVYMFGDASGSVFCNAFLSANESLPLPDCEWVNEMYKDRKIKQY